MAATGAGTGGEVRLVDLDVIKRYSLAVRQEWAPAEEVLAALDATREAVLHALGLQDDGELVAGGDGLAGRFDDRFDDGFGDGADATTGGGPGDPSGARPGARDVAGSRERGRRPGGRSQRRPG